MNRRKLKQGDIVCRAGDKSSCLFILEEGALGVFSGENSGALRLGNIEGKGITFGEIGALLEQPRSASIKALEDSIITIITVPGREFENSIVARPELGLKIAVTISKRLKATNALLNNLVELSTNFRCDTEKFHIEYFNIVNEIKSKYNQLRFPWLKEILSSCSSNSSYTRGKIVHQKNDGIYTDEIEPVKVEIDPIEFVALESTENVIECNAGEYICYEGQPGDALFILLDGKMAVYVKDMCVAEISAPGTIVGEVAAILAYRNPGVPEVRTATLRARTPIKIIRISSNQLESAFVKDPRMLLHVVKTLCEKLVQTNNCVKDLTEEMISMLEETYITDGELTLYGRITDMIKLCRKNDKDNILEEIILKAEDLKTDIRKIVTADRKTLDVKTGKIEEEDIKCRI